MIGPKGVRCNDQNTAIRNHGGKKDYPPAGLVTTSGKPLRLCALVR